MENIFTSTEDFNRENRRMVESEVAKDCEEADDNERLATLCNLVAFRSRPIHVKNHAEILGQKK